MPYCCVSAASSSDRVHTRRPNLILKLWVVVARAEALAGILGSRTMSFEGAGTLGEIMTSSVRASKERRKPLLTHGARAIGAMAAIASLGMTPAMADENVSYTYDAQARLVKVARGGSVNANTTSCYSYDDAGNRLNVTVSTVSDCAVVASPTFSISDDSANEGGVIQFIVTRSGALEASNTVQYATGTGGTATAGSDYTTKVATTLTFAVGVATQTASVATIQDSSLESNETFVVNLSNSSSGTSITDGQATGTIIDDDSNPVCSGVSFQIASNGAVAEGTNSVFTITKMGTSLGSCAVNYATANGTAVSGPDYTAKSGTLTFTSAQTSQTVSVTTINDTTAESAESFAMSLSNPTGGGVVGSPGTASATINDNDSAAPSFSIGDAIAPEGSTLYFTVTKSGTTGSSYDVSYATANGTAVANIDYTAKSGILTFLPSDTSKTIAVVTKADIMIENNETMFVNLSNASSGASILISQAVGTIDSGGGGGGANMSAPSDEVIAPDGTATTGDTSTDTTAAPPDTPE